MRIYLGGRFDVGTEIEKAWLKRTDCKYRCFTYANIDNLNKNYNKRVIESLSVCEKQGLGIMLDSGAATLHNIFQSTSKRNRLNAAKHDVDIEAVANDMFDRYAKFCLENKDKWDFYVTLDFRKSQPIIFEMQERFERIGLHPTPVYHGDSELDWLDKYADKGCKLIGLGNVFEIRSRGKRKIYTYYLDKVFNRCAKLGLNLHGLAITSLSYMLSYPWWSVDSTTWTKTASFGCLNFPDLDKGIIYNLHISEKHSKSAHSFNKMSRRHQGAVEDVIKTLGFTLKELRTDVKARHDFNGYVFSHLGDIGLDLNKVRRRTWQNLL